VEKKLTVKKKRKKAKQKEKTKKQKQPQQLRRSFVKCNPKQENLKTEKHKTGNDS